eukprot:6251577-Pyramimonas_sp.AAC.1
MPAFSKHMGSSCFLLAAGMRGATFVTAIFRSNSSTSGAPLDVDVSTEAIDIEIVIPCAAQRSWYCCSIDAAVIEVVGVEVDANRAMRKRPPSMLPSRKYGTTPYL